MKRRAGHAASRPSKSPVRRPPGQSQRGRQCHRRRSTRIERHTSIFGRHSGETRGHLLWSSASTYLGTSQTTSTAARYPTPKRSVTWSSMVSLPNKNGVNCFGIGEHHSEDFPMSARDVVLAAIAEPPSPNNISNATSEEQQTAEGERVTRRHALPVRIGEVKSLLSRGKCDVNDDVVQNHHSAGRYQVQRGSTTV